MAWAIYIPNSDKDEMVSAFTQAGLTGGEWNRIKDYAASFFAGWDAGVCIPPEHPCFATDGEDDGSGRGCMRLVVMEHGTKADFLAEMLRLLNRPQRDRNILRAYYDLLHEQPWFAVDPYPPAAGFFDGMTCT
jgi:hypothetical protein